jgi:hypothetical protein
MKKSQYFIERYAGGSKSKDFWSTVKPFLTNKGGTTQKDLLLSENNILVNCQKEICEIFYNFFFTNVAKNIGDAE